jgi:hypothetical protein
MQAHLSQVTDELKAAAADWQEAQQYKQRVAAHQQQLEFAKEEALDSYQEAKVSYGDCAITQQTSVSSRAWLQT